MNFRGSLLKLRNSCSSWKPNREWVSGLFSIITCIMIISNGFGCGYWLIPGCKCRASVHPKGRLGLRKFCFSLSLYLILTSAQILSFLFIQLETDKQPCREVLEMKVSHSQQDAVKFIRCEGWVICILLVMRSLPGLGLQKTIRKWMVTRGDKKV